MVDPRPLKEFPFSSEIHLVQDFSTPALLTVGAGESPVMGAVLSHVGVLAAPLCLSLMPAADCYHPTNHPQSCDS